MEILSDKGTTVLKVRSITRKDNKVQIIGQLMGAWDSRMYITPREIRKLIGLSLNQSLISYILLSPLFILGDYIFDIRKDLPRIFRISNIASFVLIVMIIFMAHRYTYLYPSISSFIFLILDMGKYFNLLGAIPLYGYSIYYPLRYIKKNRLRHGYIGLSYLSFGYLMMLYGTGPELASGKGIYLVI